MANPQAHDLGWYTGDFDLMCGNCKQVVRLQSSDVPRVVQSMPAFCIYCGAKTLRVAPVQGSYFGLLAEALGLQPTPSGIAVVKELFSIWNPVSGDPLHFIDFAKDMLNSA